MFSLSAAVQQLWSRWQVSQEPCAQRASSKDPSAESAFPPDAGRSMEPQRLGCLPPGCVGLQKGELVLRITQLRLDAGKQGLRRLQARLAIETSLNRNNTGCTINPWGCVASVLMNSRLVRGSSDLRLPAIRVLDVGCFARHQTAKVSWGDENLHTT